MRITSPRFSVDSTFLQPRRLDDVRYGSDHPGIRRRAPGSSARHLAGGRRPRRGALAGVPGRRAREPQARVCVLSRRARRRGGRSGRHGRPAVDHRGVSEANVELRHLRYFIAIAEEQSFTRAAERLWVAQPALSTQIRRLEAELGVQLFERHTRGADLTPAGELFLQRARLALAAVDVASATGRDLEAGVTGSVRLGVASEARWLPTSDLRRRFARARPG